MTLDGSDSGMFIAEHDVMTSPIRNQTADPRSKLVLALDKPTINEADNLVRQLGDRITIYKVGLELVLSREGLEFAERLKNEGKKIFLDMKLLDIPNTVEKAVANVARWGFDFLTVHGIDRKTLDAAVEGREVDKRSDAERLKLLSVTVMTSNTDRELREQGIVEPPLSLAVRRAAMACEAGFDGVIASGHEARPIKVTTANNPDFIIKVPGIRPSNSPVGDQSRVMTPTFALSEGATYLIIGRPITAAADPVRATEKILEEIRNAI